MTYATATDMLTRFDADEIAQRADRVMPRRVFGDLLSVLASGGDTSAFLPADVAQGQLALARVQRALDDARDTVDSYISARYTLPISPVPAILQRSACDLARFYLYDDTATEQVKDRHSAAMKLLGDVRDGKAQLGADGATGEQPASTAGAELVSGGRVWARDASQGFI
jgi:phage gp36-like protein